MIGEWTDLYSWDTESQYHWGIQASMCTRAVSEPLDPDLAVISPLLEYPRAV